MAIRPTCDKCGQELTDFGAILLSPPDSVNMVRKFHICQTCYAAMAEGLAMTSRNTADNPSTS
jgi:hypothetical protein